MSSIVRGNETEEALTILGSEEFILGIEQEIMTKCALRGLLVCFWIMLVPGIYVHQPYLEGLGFPSIISQSIQPLYVITSPTHTAYIIMEIQTQ